MHSRLIVVSVAVFAAALNTFASGQPPPRQRLNPVIELLEQ